jgi:hypothetical protein
MGRRDVLVWGRRGGLETTKLKGWRLETLYLYKSASPWLILRDVEEPARLNFRY